jgi:hypothetical protein
MPGKVLKLMSFRYIQEIRYWIRGIWRASFVHYIDMLLVCVDIVKLGFNRWQNSSDGWKQSGLIVNTVLHGSKRRYFEMMNWYIAGLWSNTDGFFGVWASSSNWRRPVCCGKRQNGQSGGTWQRCQFWRCQICLRRLHGHDSPRAQTSIGEW